MLDALSLEHGFAAADLVWLSIIQQVGLGEDIRVNELEQDAYLSTDFDPKHYIVYHSSAILLTSNAAAFDASDRVALRGRTEIPDRFEFPFLLGYNAYFGHGRPEEAATYWLEAAQLPYAPQYLASLAFRARFHTGDERGTENMLVDILPFLPERQKKDAEIRLKLIRSEYIFRDYDDACERYVETHGVRPATPRVLFDEGFVRHPPVDLFDYEISLDEECRARTEFIPIREDEAKERIGSRATHDD